MNFKAHHINRGIFCAVLLFATIFVSQPAYSWGFLRWLDEAADLGKSASKTSPSVTKIGTKAAAVELFTSATKLPGLSGKRFVVVSNIDGHIKYRTSVMGQYNELTEELLNRFKSENRVIIASRDDIPNLQNSLVSRIDGLRLNVIYYGSWVDEAVVMDGFIYRNYGENVFQKWNTFDFPSYEFLRYERIRPNDVEVISFFDEHLSDVVKRIDDAVGSRHKPAHTFEAEDIISSIQRSDSDDLLVFIGHVERDQFVMRGVDGSLVSQIPITSLEKVAEESGRGLLLLGCNTLKFGDSGFNTSVTTASITSALQVIKQGGYYHDLFASLAKASDSGLVLSKSLTRRAEIKIDARKRLDKAIDHTELGVRTVSFVSKRRVPPISSSISEIFWIALIILPILGLYGLLMNCRTIWANLEPQGYSSYSSGLIGWHKTKHVLVFCIFGPILGSLRLVAMFSLAVFLFVASWPIYTDGGQFTLCIIASIAIWALTVKHDSVQDWGIIEKLTDAFSVYAYSFGLVGIFSLIYYWEYFALEISFTQYETILNFFINTTVGLSLSHLLGRLQNKYGTRPFLLPASAILYLIILVRSSKDVAFTWSGQREIIKLALDNGGE